MTIIELVDGKISMEKMTAEDILRIMAITPEPDLTGQGSGE